MGNLNAHVIPVTSFQQNCTLLFDDETKKGVLVDPGGDFPHILNAIKDAGITVEAIWLTHGHIDHVGAAMDAKEALGVSIIGPHKADKDFLDNVETTAKSYDLAGKFRNCVPDRWLEDGDVLDCAGHTFKVLHTPGHAPGHVVFFNDDIRFIVMGDVLFRGSIGRTDLPGGDRDILLQSIKNKILPLGDDIDFIPGHGPGSTIREEKSSNPFIASIVS